MRSVPQMITSYSSVESPDIALLSSFGEVIMASYVMRPRPAVAVGCFGRRWTDVGCRVLVLVSARSNLERTQKSSHCMIKQCKIQQNME